MSLHYDADCDFVYLNIVIPGLGLLIKVCHIYLHSDKCYNPHNLPDSFALDAQLVSNFAKFASQLSSRQRPRSFQLFYDRCRFVTRG